MTTKRIGAREARQQLVAEREFRFQVLDRIRARLPDLAPDEVAAARAGNA